MSPKEASKRVVRPRTVRDVVAAIDDSNAAGSPAPVFDFSAHMNGIVQSSGLDGLVRVQPGNRSISITHQNVVELAVVTYDAVRLRVGKTREERVSELAERSDRIGEIYRGLKRLRDRYADAIRSRFPALRRRVPGIALDALLPENGFDLAKALAETDGECVTIVEATVAVDRPPPYTATVEFDAPPQLAAELVPRCNKHEPLSAIASGGRLYVTFGGNDEREARDRAEGLLEELLRDAGTPPSRTVARSAEPPGGPDLAVVPPEHLPPFLAEYVPLVAQFGGSKSVGGDFGNGCVRSGIAANLFSSEGIAEYDRFALAAARLAARFGGMFSPHLCSFERRDEVLRVLYGDQLLAALLEFRTIWDPLQRSPALG